MTEQQHLHDLFPDHHAHGQDDVSDARGLTPPTAGLWKEPLATSQDPQPQQSQYPDSWAPGYQVAWTADQAQRPDNHPFIGEESEPQLAPARSTRRQLLAVTGAVAVVAAAIVGGSVFGYNHGVTSTKAGYDPIVASQAAQVTAQAAQVSSQAAQVSSQAAQLSSQAAQASSVAAMSASSQAEDAAIPNLESVAADWPALAPDSVDASSAEVTVVDTDSTDKFSALGGFMGALGFSTATIDRMSKTRALDGTLTAEGKNCNASWTYHPDDGLQIVFEARAN